MKITPRMLNFSFFALGMVGVWFTTESHLALMWAFVASIHLTTQPLTYKQAPHE